MWNVDGPVRPCHRVEENSKFARWGDSDSLLYVSYILYDRYDMGRNVTHPTNDVSFQVSEWTLHHTTM